MICQIYPQLEGVALERFRRLSKDVMQLQRSGQLDRLDSLRDGELQRCQAEPALNGCRDKYEACTRVLIDLAKLRWRIQEDRFGIELVAPRSNVVDPAQIAAYKETVRMELAPQLVRQFSAKPVRTFIRQMEAPSASSKRKPIQLLIADGRELRSRLLEASEAGSAERVEQLAQAVQPYLQLVEPGAVDEFTNIPLGDIWRYCRYTWTLPQTNIPGRQLWYLVRDRAHPHHAIIGIAALSNAPLQMAERDDALGWTVNGFTSEVAIALDSPTPAASLPRLLDNLESNLARALDGIDATNLARPHEIADPTPELIARLRRRGDEFASARADILENFTVETPLIIQETEDLEYAMPPVSDVVLRLEAKVFGDPKTDSVRRAMVAKKRAAELARLLQARIVFRKWRALFCDPATVRATLEREEFSSAVNSALEAAKSARAGTNMLELTTCGAVKPYNAILGGKLVSLLMLSPEVASDYRRRYGAEPSIISSLIKNAPVCKDSRLVFLGTTSLYAHGPSQYNRLRLPRGVIAPEQDEIRFEMLGHTGGFGTVHFPDETMRAVERVLEQEQGFRDVNSIFGEGRSPKLRKLRAGLKLLGFDPNAVLQHHQPRCIYGIRLCAEAGEFLLGKADALPRYIERPEQYRDATARIAAFWRERWLAKRLDHAPALETLQQTSAWRLSEIIPVLDEPKAEIINPAPVDAPSATATPLALATEIEFWRTIARAGKTVCSDELNDADLARLHVQTPLEDFLISKVREGFSLVLTGNAGDGKTHLMRRLAAELERAGADVEPDATAAMRHGSVAPILDRWRAAFAANKPYCLAANEYPLYLLRRDGRPHLPLLEEVERQCRHRLAYGPPADIEDARDRVLIVDLSLRNPLGHTFAAAALEKVLAEPAVQQHAASNADATFSWNYSHLANATVRARIIALFQRLVSRGHRCSIRELWIVLTRLLFGAADNGIEPTLAPRTWYSERLFEEDDRFQLNALLRRLADPAASSHPQWDVRLEDADGTVSADWLADTHVPPLDRRALTRPQFQALKRRFYFEHRLGDEAFALQASDAREFLDLLREAATPDDIFKTRLIRAINQCYCPKPFPGSDSALHLWIGHRFHEQPSRCFLANQSIPASAFEVFVPRLPRRLSGALDYHPDHLVLEYRDANEICRLKIDYPLFSTLMKIAAGFPRHLAAERDLNRLDAFLDEIKGREPERKRQFILFSSESRLVTRVTLAPDFKQYTEVERL